MRRALYSILLVALLLALGACDTGTTTTNQPPAQANVTELPTKTPAPPTATPKSKIWVTVQTFSGNQNTKTPTFQLNDGARMVWSAKPTSQYGGYFSVTTYTSDGAYGDLVANTTINKAESGVSNVHGSAKIYLDVNEYGTSYTKGVQEYR